MTLLGLTCFGFFDANGCQGGCRSTFGTYKNLPDGKHTAFRPLNGTELRSKLNTLMSCLIKLGFGVVPLLWAWQDAATH